MSVILVTGSAGFIGASVAKKLLQSGHEVIGLDNINDYYSVDLKYARLADCGISFEEIEYGKLVKSTLYPNYKFIKLDLIDSERLNLLFAEHSIEIVCNLAAQAGVRYSLENPHSYINSNVLGFLNILEACRFNDIKHLVYASSSSVYGNQEKKPFSIDDNVDFPISLYAATKKSNELMAHCYTHLFNLPTTALRFFTVYGPWGRPDMAPMLFANAIMSGKPIKVFNNGNLERDFTYIDDIVEGVVRVILESQIKQEKYYKIYNIGNNKPVKLMDFIETLEEALGKEAIKEFLPMQPGDVYSTYADISQMETDFNYAPKTDIKEGIEQFAKWFKKYLENGE